MEPKAALRDDEYVINRVDALANGGPVKGPGKRIITCCEFPCPYCSKPEGWDACPIHRDGTPTTA
jgi:hypothetical protein